MRSLFRIVTFALATVLLPLSVSAQSDESEGVLKKDVITQPEYKGGYEEMYKFIMDNFVYPLDANKRSVSGVVEMEFTVEKSGDLSFVGINKGIEESVDVELIRVFKAMPRWTPATLNGEPVRYKVSMPVTLRVSRARNGQKSEMAI